MSSAKIEGEAQSVRAVREAAAEGAEQADPREVEQADARLEQLLDRVAERDEAAAAAAARLEPRPEVATSAATLTAVAMCTATPTSLRGRRVSLRQRGTVSSVEGELGPGVARELVERAIRDGEAVLVECPAGRAPVVVGVVQSRIPREMTIKAGKVHIDAEQELLLRSGRSAMRLRQDGDVELVGGRIAVMSRGLFRLVGRVLRLN